MTATPAPKAMGVSERYDLIPSTTHEPGDIWSGLPANWIGVGGGIPLGIVISPACDLAHCKTESVTYLPVVPLREYLTSIAVVRQLRGSVESVLTGLGIEPPNAQPQRALPPPASELELAKTAIFAKRESEGAKSGSLLDRALAGIEALAAVRANTLTTTERLALVKSALGGKEFSRLAESVLRNTELATHYLAPDGQPVSQSAIAEPSVALLRFPMTVPMALLDLAQSVPAPSWPTTMESMGAIYAAGVLPASRPIKIAAMKPRWTVDLLNRFAALYTRLGAPDLPTDHIDNVIATL